MGDLIGKLSKEGKQQNKQLKIENNPVLEVSVLIIVSMNRLLLFKSIKSGIKRQALFN